MPDQDEEKLFTDEDETAEASVQLPTVHEREVYTTPSDPDVKTLLGRIEDKSLILHPKFQRASVWDNKRKSRLVESLLLNLPIPPCFLAEDEDGTRVVVDGQQRLIAIDDFYHGRYELTGLEVLADLNGMKWADLPPRYDRKMLQRVIRTLVISYYTNPEIRFIIFERLNTGAVPLLDQEIRNATLSGSFNTLLDELAKSAQFQNALGIDVPDLRLRHHELVLRFFAVDSTLEDYRPPLKLILTNYMRAHRNAIPTTIAALKAKFEESLNASVDAFGDNVFRKFRVQDPTRGAYEGGVSKALFDLQMITLGGIPQQDLAANRDAINDAFQQLVRNDHEFSEALSRATDHRSRFYLRLRRWTAALEVLGMHSPAADRLPAEE
ncbi:MAG: DUF262 domain-containing protein [Acidobacteriales bacterium]|nr:DUF262 domain-containing protein [Terriglobales bacterium]